MLLHSVTPDNLIRLLNSDSPLHYIRNLVKGDGEAGFSPRPHICCQEQWQAAVATALRLPGMQCSALLCSCLTPSSALPSTSIGALETVPGGGGASGELVSALTVTLQLLGALCFWLRGCSWTMLGISRGFIHCGLPELGLGQAVLRPACVSC